MPQENKNLRIFSDHNGIVDPLRIAEMHERVVAEKLVEVLRPVDEGGDHLAGEDSLPSVQGFFQTFLALVMALFLTRSRTPSENISV